MRITGRQLRQIIKEEVENMMSEEDSTIKFGQIPKTTEQVDAEAQKAAAPKSANDLVAKIREAISAGAGGLGLVESISAYFVPGSRQSIAPFFGMAIYDGDVKKVVIKGSLTAKTFAKNGKARVEVSIAPDELYVNGKLADERSAGLAERGFEDYMNRKNMYNTAFGIPDYKTFKGEVRATVSASNGSVKVVIDGITAS